MISRDSSALGFDPKASSDYYEDVVQQGPGDSYADGFQSFPGNPNANLIVNYLPHDIDDLALKVNFI